MKFLYLLLIFCITLQASYSELLYNGNCLTCHKYKKSSSAPSLKEIQKVYLNAFSKKKDFINYMSAWVLNPNEKTSLMSEAIKKYKLMPYLAYDKKSLEMISDYIFEDANK